MSSNPINLGLRFILEIGALLALGIWGWQKGDGWVKFLLAVGIPLIAAILWATFRVPNDPGNAPIAVPGMVRLAFEAALFAFATWALHDSGRTPWAWAFGIVIVLHYAMSYDRILWLIRQ
jgi:hypothetical protein